MQGSRTAGLRLLAATLVLALSSAFAGTAHADAEEDMGRPDRGRSLDSHQFSDMALVEWPFVSSRATSEHSFGLAQFEVNPNVPGLDRTFDGEFVNYLADLNFGVAATPWLGIEAKLNGAFIVGTDIPGGLTVGTNGVYGGGLGVVVRLLELDHLYLSVRAKADGARFESLAPVRLLVPADGLSFGALSAEGSIWTFGGDLLAALAWGEWFGIQASGTAVGRRIEIGPTDELEGTLSGALGFSIDFRPIRLPLELVVAGRVSWDFADEINDLPVSAVRPTDDLRWEPEFGLVYSGMPELDLGVYATSLLSDKGDRMRGGFRLGYYW